MGAKISLIDKYRYSYTFGVKKKGDKYIPLFEKISPNKVLFVQVRVKI
ncbi:MAG: hypothetical protein ABDH49_02445 [Candidatus Hydrothermales bacterium]